MRVAAAPPAPGEASTLGWDSVFALTLDEVNAAILKRKAWPLRLDRKPSGPLQFGLKADFGQWQMTTGGDGGVVNFLLPMTNLVADYVLKGTPGQVTCSSAEAVIAIRLLAVAHVGPALKPDGTVLPASPAGATRHALRARSTSTNPLDPVASLVSLTFTSPLSDLQADQPIEAAIVDWCNANMDQFEHIFAFLDIYDAVANGKWAFCKPNAIDYAYVDRASGDGLLGVLAMTSNTPAPSIQQVSSHAVPLGCGAGFLLGTQRFLLDLIEPGLTKLWPDLTTGKLELTSDLKTLRMKDNISATLPDVTDDQGNTYSPKMIKFEVSISGDEMIITLHTETEVSPGIYATCSSTSYYDVALGKNKAGEQTITYVRPQTSVNVHGNRSDPGIAVLSKILTVCTIVAGLLSIVLTDGADTVAVVALLICLVGKYELTDIGQANEDLAPSLDDLTTNLTGPISWNDKDFVMSQTGLRGSLQLGGVWS